MGVSSSSPNWRSASEIAATNKILDNKARARFYVWNRASLENEGKNMLRIYTILKFLLLLVYIFCVAFYFLVPFNNDLKEKNQEDTFWDTNTIIYIATLSFVFLLYTLYMGFSLFHSIKKYDALEPADIPTNLGILSYIYYYGGWILLATLLITTFTVSGKAETFYKKYYSNDKETLNKKLNSINLFKIISCIFIGIFTVKSVFRYIIMKKSEAAYEKYTEFDTIKVDGKDKDMGDEIEAIAISLSEDNGEHLEYVNKELEKAAARRDTHEQFKDKNKFDVHDNQNGTKTWVNKNTGDIHHMTRDGKHKSITNIQDAKERITSKNRLKIMEQVNRIRNEKEKNLAKSQGIKEGRAKGRKEGRQDVVKDKATKVITRAFRRANKLSKGRKEREKLLIELGKKSLQNREDERKKAAAKKKVLGIF